MIVFIIPLKSKSTSACWERVSQLFERCLKSVCSQTISDFRVIVVCHERPNINFEHPSVQYLEVDFEPPTLNPKSTDVLPLNQDRNRKVFTGLLQAQEIKPSHIMIVEADDCINKNIAEFVKNNASSDGWLINRGYEHVYGSRYVYLRKKNFYRKCGTCHIIKYETMYDLCQELNFDADGMIFHHQQLTKFLRNQGILLKELPFEGAIYVINHGNNNFARPERYFKVHQYNFRKIFLFYMRKLFKRLNAKFLSYEIRNKFNFYELEL
jgi:hypothetical protein